MTLLDTLMKAYSNQLLWSGDERKRKMREEFQRILKEYGYDK